MSGFALLTDEEVEALEAENARLSALVETLEADRDAVILERDRNRIMAENAYRGECAHREEEVRLRAALEQYADPAEWEYDDCNQVWLFGDPAGLNDKVPEPWLVAREALGREASAEGEGS